MMAWVQTALLKLIEQTPALVVVAILCFGLMKQNMEIAAQNRAEVRAMFNEQLKFMVETATVVGEAKGIMRWAAQTLTRTNDAKGETQ